jgi:hypothetical protein
MKKKKDTKTVSRRETTKKRRQDAFLKEFKICATVTHAAKLANIGRQTHYDWLRKDEEYQVAFAEAEIAATDALVAEARRRATEGVEEPVYYKGEVVGTIQKYSDTLLIFLLKGALPEIYRERYEISGGDKAIRVKSDPGREKLADDTLKALIDFGEQLRRTQGDRGGESPQ